MHTFCDKDKLRTVTLTRARIHIKRIPFDEGILHQSYVLSVTVLTSKVPGLLAPPRRQLWARGRQHCSRLSLYLISKVLDDKGCV